MKPPRVVFRKTVSRVDIFAPEMLMLECRMWAALVNCLKLEVMILKSRIVELESRRNVA